MAKEKKPVPADPPVQKNNLFPEKPIIDMTFLDHLIFSTNGRVIDTKKDLDSALGEINHLYAKKKELKSKVLEYQFQLMNKHLELDNRIQKENEVVTQKLNEYFDRHPSEIHFKDKEDGTQEAIINLDHGSVVITRVTKTKIEIKPAKDPSPVTKKHKRQLEPA
jgi:hypothetical protein